MEMIKECLNVLCEFIIFLLKKQRTNFILNKKYIQLVPVEQKSKMNKKIVAYIYLLIHFPLLFHWIAN